MKLEPLAEQDIDEAVTILDAAFASMHRALFRQVPPGKREGARVRDRFYRPDTLAVAIRDARDQLRGVCLAQLSGNYAVVGPLAVHPTHDEIGTPFESVGRYLLESTIRSPLDIADTVTFPHSPLHLKGHWQAFDPLFPAPFLVRRHGGSERNNGHLDRANLTIDRYSRVAEAERVLARAGLAAICEESQPGYDLTAEMTHVDTRHLGDTWLLRLDDKLAAFAICHFGPRSEAFTDEQCLIKHLHVAGHGPMAVATFHRLLGAIEDDAQARGLTEVATMVSAGRRASLDALLARSYRIVEVHAHWRRALRSRALRPGGSDHLSDREHALALIRPDQLALAELR